MAEIPRWMPSLWFWALVLLALAMAVVLAATGWLAGGPQPDTEAYLAPARWPDMLGAIRSPLYGFLLLPFGRPPSFATIAFAHTALHIAACLALFAGARAAGVPAMAAFALGASALFSQGFLVWGRYAIPESPAVSLLLMAFALTLAASRSERWFALAFIPAAIAAGLAYTLRPTMLPAIAVLPPLWAVFAARRQAPRIVPRSLAFALACAMPFLAQATVRKVMVDDFNMVSFGGYQMTGLAGQIIDDSVIARLSGDTQQMAADILAARQAGEKAGDILPVPPNSSGVRSINSIALGYFDLFARNYDAVLIRIAALQKPDESWIAFNKRMMNLSLAILVAAPERWGAWVAGASARLAGRAIVINATFGVAVLLAAAMFAAGPMLRAGPAGSMPGFIEIAIVVAAWIAATAPLTVLITYPGGRYVDTVSMLLAALPLLLALGLWPKRRIS